MGSLSGSSPVLIKGSQEECWMPCLQGYLAPQPLPLADRAQLSSALSTLLHTLSLSTGLTTAATQLPSPATQPVRDAMDVDGGAGTEGGDRMEEEEQPGIAETGLVASVAASLHLDGREGHEGQDAAGLLQLDLTNSMGAVTPMLASPGPTTALPAAAPAAPPPQPPPTLMLLPAELRPMHRPCLWPYTLGGSALAASPLAAVARDVSTLSYAAAVAMAAATWSGGSSSSGEQPPNLHPHGA